MERMPDMRLRVKFKKYGPVRFIGHLDVMRYFQKAIRRAGIDVSYSTGFSPHQIMSFAAPLGVGLTSNGEYMDVEVDSLPRPENGSTSCRTAVRKLNEAGVKGIDVIDVHILPENAGNAMASVAAASYTVRFRQDRLPLSGGESVTGFSLQQMCDDLLRRSEIMVIKETKRGTREVDLRPGIYSLAWKNGCYHMLLDASSAGNIKPVQVMEAMFADSGFPLQKDSLLVTREDVFTREGETGEFISLGDIGYEDGLACHQNIETGGVS